MSVCTDNFILQHLQEAT